jgi:cobalt/nickel transport system permease protein
MARASMAFLGEAPQGGETSALQRADARAKLLACASLVMAVAFMRGLGGLAVILAAVLAAAWLSGVPLRRFLAPVMAAALFSGLVAFPAALNVMTPGPVLASLLPPSGHLPEGLSVTATGVTVALRLGLRSVACVAAVSLLASSTPAALLMKALRFLGVPRVPVAILAMMVRFLDLLLRAGRELHLAKLSRSLGDGRILGEQAWVSAGIAKLFGRASRLSADVYNAMIARGYTGEHHAMSELSWRWTDSCLLGSVVVFAALALAFERIP